MPWKEYRIVDDQVKLLARLLDGNSMTSICELRAT